MLEEGLARVQGDAMTEQLDLSTIEFLLGGILALLLWIVIFDYD